ncbi:MAG: helix-turn-helix domain-containing protein [Betaproteobacteria bacterium]|nr:helix-turn-helix domain-containing protein [Betaproteobacteria bacterium]MBK9785905.1 helix-turn-helix domain-containing protein [Candidatus Dechloromonas phosphorivorans]UCV19803.1 helix-turn-helix domain-containing protein [Ferribacterium limneticum]
MDKEMEQFQNDLLASVRQMKTGKAARVTAVEVSAATEARNRVGMSQSEFAKLLGVSVRTLQDWEQGRREPSGAAKTLLRIASQNPEAVKAAA